MNRICGLLLSICFALIGLIALLFGMSSSSVMAEQPVTPEAAIIVDTLDDELNSDGDCSLREAIKAASTNTPVDTCRQGDVITDTIIFDGSGTITVTSQLSVTAGGPLVIDGGEVITTSGGGKTRIFFVDSGAALAIQKLNVVDGVVITQFPAKSGGGIFNQGNLVILSSTVSRNNVYGEDVGCSEAWGGGISNWGELTIISSTISDNYASTYSDVGYGDYCLAAGGGISNWGELTIISSTISDNRVSSYAQSVFPRCDLVTFIVSEGGGILNFGDLIIVSSTISNNEASAGGHGYCVDVEAAGGGIYNYGRSSFTKSLAVSNKAESDCLDCFTFGHGGGGGFENTGDLLIVNSTISNNRAYEPGEGSGIRNSGVLTITNSTISGNNSASGIQGAATAYNTIIANNPISNCSGPITDGGYNLDSEDTCGFIPGKGSLINTDPMLGLLQNNGGSTWTQALLAGSPAIDHGDMATCPPTDQRGVNRPVDGNGDGQMDCDIGSYEFEQGIGLYPVQLTGYGLPGSMVSYTIQLYNFTNLTDTYTLASYGNLWQATLSTSSVGPVEPGAGDTFTVSVAIPEGDYVDSTDTMTIRATSLTSPTIYSATTIITTQILTRMYFPEILKKPAIP